MKTRAEQYQELFDSMMRGDREFLRDVVDICPENYALIEGPAQRILENRAMLQACLDSLIDEE